jgi:tryptophan-rich sensory protein
MKQHAALKQSVGLVGWIAATCVAGALGAWASANAASFYGQLVQPTWSPPAWLFGPVWTALYLLMAIAAWLVWRPAGFSGARVALGVFVAQLGANALWSWLFFSWRLGALAFVEILLLWGLIALTIVLFWRHTKVAALLLVPYLAWVGFAAVLSFALWRSNPSVLG